MQEFMRALEGPDRWVTDSSPETFILALLLAFVLGQALGWLYLWTHGGLSYSRAFTQSLVLLTVIVTVVMFVIGNSIVTAFGLLGALAIIRFRNVLKDTRDTVFVFFSLVMGMAVGSQRFLIAILGLVAFVLIVAYLRYTSFGSRGGFDGHLTLRVVEEKLSSALAVVDKYCRRATRMSEHRLGDEGVVEFVYQIRLRDQGRSGEMVGALEEVVGVGGLSLVLRDELAEF